MQSLSDYSSKHLLPAQADECDYPDTLQKTGNGSLDDFRRDLEAPWDSAKVEKQRTGLLVRSLKRDDMPYLRFRIDATLQAASVQAALDGLRYENRLRWDANVVAPSYLKRFRTTEGGGTEAELVSYYTAPAAMGLISGRSLVDLRVAKTTQVGGSTVIETTSITPGEAMLCGIAEVGEWYAMADAAKLVRAVNVSGSGSRLVGKEGVSGGAVEVQWTMITTIDLGGSLPAGLVNSATGGALAKFAEGLQKELLRGCKK